MKSTFFAIVLAVAAWPMSAMAADPAPTAPAAKTTQQQRMKNCNAEAKAKTLKGQERKTFMSQCLKAK